MAEKGRFSTAKRCTPEILKFLKCARLGPLINGDFTEVEYLDHTANGKINVVVEKVIDRNTVMVDEESLNTVLDSTFMSTRNLIMLFELHAHYADMEKKRSLSASDEMRTYLNHAMVSVILADLARAVKIKSPEFQRRANETAVKVIRNIVDPLSTDPNDGIIDIEGINDLPRPLPFLPRLFNPNNFKYVDFVKIIGLCLDDDQTGEEELHEVIKMACDYIRA